MGLLTFQDGEGGQVLVDKTPLEGAGAGLGFDQLGGPEHRMGRLRYAEPTLDPNLVFEINLALIQLGWAEFELDIQSGGSFAIDEAALSFLAYDMDFAGGSTVEIESPELTFTAYDLSVPAWLGPDLWSFLAYDLDVKAGTAVNVENQAWTMTQYDVTPSASPPLRLTHVGITGANNGGSLVGSIAAPAGEVGDLLVVFSFGSSSYHPAVPSGFAEVFYNTATGAHTRCCFKVTTGDTENVNLDDNGGFIWRVRPNKAVSSVTAPLGSNIQLTSGNPSAQVYDSSPLTAPVLYLGLSADADSASGTAFSAVTPAFDGTLTLAGPISALGGYKITNPYTTPTDFSVDMSDLGGSNYLASTVLLLS